MVYWVSFSLSSSQALAALFFAMRSRSFPSSSSNGFNNHRPMFGNETDHHLLVFRNAIA